MTEQERKLIEQKDFFGNAILYELCADYPLGMGEKDGYTKQDAFSTQSWLIGRAYAASPQRRRYKNLKVEFDGPDGLDGFFEVLAKEFYELPETANFIETVNLLKGKKYTFTEEQDDVSLLIAVIRNVLRLNKLLGDSILAVDKQNLMEAKENTQEARKKLSNHISFCSKFLHFHYPNSVFIIDSISFMHFKIKQKQNYEFLFLVDKGTSKTEKGSVSISKKEVEDMLNKLKGRLEDGELGSNYCKHCVREYLVAKQLFGITQDKSFGGKSIPRMVDIYVMNANKK